MTGLGENDSDGMRPDDGIGNNPSIFADVAGSFTYASYQNAIPVVRSIRIENCGDRYLEKCRVELTSSPAFLRSKSWIIDRLAPRDSLPLSDRKVDLDADYLAGLNEAERGEITLRLSADGVVFDEKRFAVRLLARDEWGGVADMAQLLPAFVMPNDPAVARILRSAADRLAEHGHPSGLDGYQSGDPRRTFMLAAAIYSVIAAMAIHYAEPPASFEDREAGCGRDRRQQSLEPLPRFGQFSRDTWRASVDLGPDMVRDQADDALAVGGRDMVAGVGQAAAEAINPEAAVGVEHDLDHARIGKQFGDHWPERGAQHARAAGEALWA